MQGVALRAVADLVPATGAVGDDQRFRIRLAHCRQQARLGHFHRHIVMRRFVAEGAGHAAATRGHELDRQFRHQSESFLYRSHRIESLLMTMAVKQRFFLRQ